MFSKLSRISGCVTGVENHRYTCEIAYPPLVKEESWSYPGFLRNIEWISGGAMTTNPKSSLNESEVRQLTPFSLERAPEKVLLCFQPRKTEKSRQLCSGCSIIDHLHSAQSGALGAAMWAADSQPTLRLAGPQSELSQDLHVF